MSHEDVLDITRRRPFKPFRLFITDGSVYEVRHPELFMLGLRSAVVGLPRDPEQTVYERAVTVDLVHITQLEPLEKATSVSGNGQ